MSISCYSTANNVSQYYRKGQFESRAFRATHRSRPDWLLMTIVTLLRNPPGEPSKLTPYMTANITSILLRLMDGLNHLFANNNKRICWPSGNRRITDTGHTWDWSKPCNNRRYSPPQAKQFEMTSVYDCTIFSFSRHIIWRKVLYKYIKMYLPWAVIAIQWTWLIVNGYCYVIASIGKIMSEHRGPCPIASAWLIWPYEVSLEWFCELIEVCSDENI